MSTKGPSDARRGLPSVDAVMRWSEVSQLAAEWGSEIVTGAVRAALSGARAAMGAGGGVPSEEEILADVSGHMPSSTPSLRPVINATGVILHTNLGRAPLAADAARAASAAAQGYSNLEYDLVSGSRGSRYGHCTDLVSRLTGAAASLVVNNNAAAVSLAINTLAAGRDVVVSRGELVEIGGGFRIPEVIERSGAFLSAVGSTNRTRVDDYRRAVTPSTGLLLKIHPSNYRIEGFSEEVSLEALVDLGRSLGLPVMHDLGSGLLLDVDLPSLREPRVRESVTAGADIVTWSGDKLLGGPQAGIIHGRQDLVERMLDNPLLRAFRVDKFTLAALEATLRLYAVPERAVERIPVLRMLHETAASVETRAKAARETLSETMRPRVTVARMRSVLGGGTAPGFELDSAGWVVSGNTAVIDSVLRRHDPPVVGRIQSDRLLLDFRTLLEGQEGALTAALELLADEGGGEG